MSPQLSMFLFLISRCPPTHIHSQEEDAQSLSDIPVAPFLNNFSALPSCYMANISLSSWSLFLTCVMRLADYYKLGPRPNF